MFPKNIPLYKLDLSGKNPDNKVSQEYYRRLDLEHDIAFVLRSGPFYTESLVLTQPNGTELIEGTDYEIYGIASDLTAFVKDKEVGMMILMKNQNIGEWFAEYQVVGHFSIINRDLVNMVNGAVDDDRPVLYKNLKNRPLWFNPELHQHDLRYEIHSFTDLIACIKRIKDVKAVLPDRNLIEMDHFHTVILTHIEAYEKMLLSYIAQHDSEDTPPYTNSHGLTAEQVNMELVDNFETATLLDILDGFRKDLHVTADLLKRAVDTIGKETETLVKLGSIPVLRYGSNSFIPSPIKGSYEGMGGNDFYMGTNIETNGDTHILMNRNDGRVDGLYFMENKTKNAPSDKWAFTGYQYKHQTPIADGVSINKILRGSNGKFLVVGGYDANGNTVWYYSLGNGTLDPAKHTLIKLPDEMQSMMRADAVLCTDAFPSRILLSRVINQEDAWNDDTLRGIGFSLPNAGTSFEGFTINSGMFMGQYMWEFDVASKTWRKVIFNYTQAIDGTAVKSNAWIPFRYVIQETTADNPRADGVAYKYGLKQAEYVFSKMITYWNFRRWIDVNLDKYDEDTDAIAIKYICVPYGSDERNGSFDSTYCSLGIVLKNRNLGTDSVEYTVENRKSLSKPSYLDTTTTGVRVENIVTGAADHIELGIRGTGTYCWLTRGKIFAAGTAAYGTFPMNIKTADFAGLGSFESFNNFVDQRFDQNLGGSSIPYSEENYNEINPANLTIGAHSTFWTQLDPNNVDTYGAASFSTAGLWFRRQPALDASGYPVVPSKVFNLYKNDGTNKRTSYGYELTNDVYQLGNNPGEVFCTNIFANVANNRRTEYLANMIGHHSYPGEMVIGNQYSTAATANYTFTAEWGVEVNAGVYKIVPKKKYNLEDQIKNILLPKVKAALSDSAYNFNHSLAAFRIGYTNVIGTTHDKLLIFTVPVINTSNQSLYVACVAFNLTGGTPDSTGIIQNATVTPVGNVLSTLCATILPSEVEAYTADDPTVVRYIQVTFTQPRDLVMQLSNGDSMVIMQMPTTYSVKGNRYEAGLAMLVDQTGIKQAVEKSVYYTAGGYRFFHHPYYGTVLRRFGIGPSELGYPSKTPGDLSFPNDSSKLALGNSNYLESAFSIYFSAVDNVILNGREYSLGASIYNLSNLTPEPRNKTFYVYLDYDGSGAYYNVSLTPLAETPSRGLISIVRTNDDSIYEIENYNVFTMNSIRISTVKHGSVIPAATGTIELQGQVEGWVTNSRV